MVDVISWLHTCMHVGHSKPAHLKPLFSEAGLSTDPLRSIVVEDVEVFVLAVEVVAECLDIPARRLGCCSCPDSVMLLLQEHTALHTKHSNLLEGCQVKPYICGISLAPGPACYLVELKLRPAAGRTDMSNVSQYGWRSCRSRCLTLCPGPHFWRQ